MHDRAPAGGVARAVTGIATTVAGAGAPAPAANTRLVVSNLHYEITAKDLMVRARVSSGSLPRSTARDARLTTRVVAAGYLRPSGHAHPRANDQGTSLTLTTLPSDPLAIATKRSRNEVAADCRLHTAPPPHATDAAVGAGFARMYETCGRPDVAFLAATSPRWRFAFVEAAPMLTRFCSSFPLRLVPVGTKTSMTAAAARRARGSSRSRRRPRRRARRTATRARWRKVRLDSCVPRRALPGPSSKPGITTGRVVGLNLKLGTVVVRAGRAVGVDSVCALSRAGGRDRSDGRFLF